MRTCAGCGAKAPKRDLVRLALEPGGRAVVDRAQRRPGRGAYVHPDDACLQRAARRGGLARAFRARVESAPDGLES
ncbi:MAG: YlxR family protein [Actinobacteria bacterium]|nr:MAG: YlxR family protein [Actinomycetota bacterium]